MTSIEETAKAAYEQETKENEIEKSTKEQDSGAPKAYPTTKSQLPGLSATGRRVEKPLRV